VELCAKCARPNLTRFLICMGICARASFLGFRCRSGDAVPQGGLGEETFVQWHLGFEALKEHTLDRYMEAAHRFLPKAGIHFGSAPSNILIIQTAFSATRTYDSLVGALHEQFPASRWSFCVRRKSRECSSAIRDLGDNPF